MDAEGVASADVAVCGGEGGRRADGGPPLWMRPQDDRGHACVDMVARDGRMGCRRGCGRSDDSWVCCCGGSRWGGEGEFSRQISK